MAKKKRSGNAGKKKDGASSPSWAGESAEQLRKTLIVDGIDGEIVLEEDTDTEASLHGGVRAFRPMGDTYVEDLPKIFAALAAEEAKRLEAGGLLSAFDEVLGQASSGIAIDAADDSLDNWDEETAHDMTMQSMVDNPFDQFLASLEVPVDDIDPQAAREQNKKCLAEYEEALRKAGLSENTINKHVANVEFFLNTWLLDFMEAGMDEGPLFVDLYLGDWFIDNYVGATGSVLRDNATAIKKFYKLMLDNGYIEKSVYDIMMETCKNEMRAWMREADRRSTRRFPPF